MNKFFEIAILLTIVITFANGFIFAFAPVLIGQTIMAPTNTQANIGITAEDVNSIARASQQNIVTTSNPLSQVGIWLSGLLGSVVSALPGSTQITQAMGGAFKLTEMIFNFATAYKIPLQAIFGGMPLIMSVINFTIMPFLFLIQIIAIVYLLATLLSAVTGGGAG